jgi:sulfite dehydrogenase (quinone) subunit SoeA
VERHRQAQGRLGARPASPEGGTGFLLNHLIPERLPNSPLPNADPVTGQAAWFDLRVRIERLPADRAPARSAPDFPPMKVPAP